MKKFLVAVLAFVLSTAPVFATGSSIALPKGFHGKVYNGALALYASSQEADVQDRFICTVQVIAKVKGGYELLGAGHCTPANTEDLPSDMTFSVATDLNGALMPVKLVKAKMEEPVDYAIYYLPTNKKLPVIPLGDEHQMKIDDKTIDVNYSLALAKEVSLGVVSRQVQTDGPMEGFFEVTEFDSHGASGSSVVSQRTKSVIGIVIAGVDGTTTPTWVEPISVIEKEIAGVDVVNAPAMVVPKESDVDGRDVPIWQRGHGSSHPNHPSDNHPSRPTHTNHPEHSNPPARNHQGSREHHRINRNHDVRVIDGHHCFGWYGSWFYVAVYPDWFWTEDVYLVEGPDGVWFVYDYANPTLFVQVTIVE